MAESFFWYDFESTGIDPRRDRPLQVAGVRTDVELNEVDDPLCIDCQLSPDILPHPMACLVTGIGPERVMAGLPEAEFIQRLHHEMATPGTCSVGYNNLRFDDEMTRFSLYRNFYDPYAREWQSGNSRWDLLDGLRAAHALRPEGIEWPQQDGLVSLRLELLTAANGIDHGQAHDALADVRATIAMARLLRQTQPKLFNYLLGLRRKPAVNALIDLRNVRPLVHVSGRFGRERHGLALVLPLGWHPVNRNALIVYDLAADPGLLNELTAEQLRQRLYARQEDLAEGQQRPGLKLVHINRCPFLADLKVLRAEDIARLGLDMPRLLANAQALGAWRETGQALLREVYSDTAEQKEAQSDPELQLYDGFLNDTDRQLLPDIRQADPDTLARHSWPLRDQRLVDLLFRYRARNFPDTLTASEQEQWRQFCRQRLQGRLPGAPLTLADFNRVLSEAMPQASAQQQQLLQDWQRYAEDLARYLAVKME
ncbi:exodeoxyribonuclease I [Pseudomonas jilinensis]|uniref:Exodeoxyribonuclease I n=1 Tax=Pseudomonas jilinensis TaxID=2078689 RepID=A0A396RZA6_9PSED|nr:exodeoxyribonuclease I [Pseudomonas jilinensis]RHW21990.1 exodeoxyribonuclease I [Pseudomonas jilinensis]